MQTPKPKAGTLEVPKRKSPAAMPKAARQLKPGSDADSLSSPNQVSPIPKDRSPKVVQRRSPHSPLSEKKRPSRVAELETQLAQLQEDLKKAKDELNASESSKRQGQQEAQEAQKHVLVMSAKLEESQQQLSNLSASDDDRIQELRKLSQERDRAWQSELEAVQRQHEFDSTALASAMNEIQKLKAQQSNSESEDLRIELAETRSLVERLKMDVLDCKESEARAQEVLGRTEMELDRMNETSEILRSEGIKAKEALKILSMELEQSKARAQSLEEEEDTNSIKEELTRTKHEVGQLRSALEAAEIRYQEECNQNMLQIKNAHEQGELTKSEWSKREAHLVAELNMKQTKIEDLRAILMEKEAELQEISEENEGLNVKIEKNKSSERETELTDTIKKLESSIADLRARLLDKETELQGIAEENEALKIEIKKIETERNEVNSEAIEAARAAEQEALVKLTHLSEEAERSSKRAARVIEQLDATQAANAEMEAEMRRLKVQSDQWRKAAEAAATMLSTGNNGKIVERTGSLDSGYVARTGSPYLEGMDLDSPKKRYGNVLKKIGGLWKKGH